MDEGDVVISECQYVARDASVYLLCASVILEVFVVCDDPDLVCCAHEEMVPVFQSSHNCEEFSVPDGVVSFCFIERFGVISNWVSSALRVVLP